MSHVLCGYLFSRASNTIDCFDPFNIFQANRLSANPALFHHLRGPRRLAWLLPWREMRCFESIVRRSCGRSTRGFTLEEVLIMAAMNLFTSADTAAKREKRASPK